MENTISRESILCAPLYSDMAAASFGLYENKESYLPYALFTVSYDKQRMWVFSSKSYEKLGETVDIRSFLRDSNGLDLLKLPMLKYTPYIASFALPMYNGEVTIEGLKKFLFTHLPNTLQCEFCWPIIKNKVFIALYREKPLKKVPDLVCSAVEYIHMLWREYFNVKDLNLSVPRYDINSIIEGIFGNQQDQDRGLIEYFPTLTRISALSYESKHSKGCITITADENEDPFIQIDSKENPLLFSQENGKQLRKLLEITKDNLSLLVYSGKVFGIGISSNPLFNFKITGHMEWHLNECNGGKEKQLLRFKHGEYYLPRGSELRDWYINSRTEYCGNEIKRTVYKLLDEDNINHGALFIIMNKKNVLTEVERLCAKKRGISTEPIDLLSNTDKTSALCAIDGALLLDEAGICYGIGIILDGEAKVDGTPARGARFNSTKTYIARCCAEKIVACAIIISQDGYIDILSTYDSDCQPAKEE